MPFAQGSGFSTTKKADPPSVWRRKALRRLCRGALVVPAQKSGRAAAPPPDTPAKSFPPKTVDGSAIFVADLNPPPFAPGNPYPFLACNPQSEKETGDTNGGLTQARKKISANNSLGIQKDRMLWGNFRNFLISQCPGLCGKFLRSPGGPVGGRPCLSVTSVSGGSCSRAGIQRGIFRSRLQLKP